ncbi:MAG: murein biosynthesis integral membrane protein MurJ [Thermoleophilia bacterium]
MSARRAAARTGGAHRSIGRSTAVFAVWTGVSRVAGLAREILAAALFGTKGPIAAFVIAFQVPNLLRSLVADSALSAAFLPVFTELEEKGRHAEARRLAGALVGMISIGLGLLSLVAVVTAPWVMPLFAPGLEDDLQDDLVRLSQIMFPIVVLLGLTGLVSAVLQAGNRFGPTAFVPVLWNVVIIFTLLVATPLVADDDRVTFYAVAIVLGTIAQLLWLLPSLRGLGPFPLSLGFGNPYVKRVLILMLPVTLGLGLINVNLVIDGAFASLVSDESVRAIDAAFRLYLLPQGMFSVAISTVLFPSISRLAAREDWEGMRDTIADGLRQIFFMLLPASAFLLVLSEPMVRLVYERGEFDAQSTTLTNEALFMFAIGLAFNGASLLVIRALFSLQLPWLATKVSAFGVLLNVALDAAFYKPFGTGGIPLATSLASIVTFIALTWMVERELGGLHREWILDGVMRSAVASAIAALLGWASWRVLDDALGQSLGAQLLSVGTAVAAAAIAYLSAAQAFEMHELRALSRLVRPLR